MAGEPILGKRQDMPVKVHRPFTWTTFRRLREWAKGAADATGYPVYLVGSALSKYRPRDIDVAIIVPVADFERQHGPIPSEPGTPEMHEYLRRVHQSIQFHDFDAQEAVKWRKRVDVKLTPDTWWPEKDRLLLAAPPRKVSE